MSGFNSADILRAAVFAALLAPGLAFGQGGAPLRLGPPGAGAGVTPPAVIPLSPARPQATEGIQPVGSQDLTANAAWGGTLDRIAGGLGRDMWGGTSADVAARLLADLPTTTESPALRDLAVRILLSRATDPVGDETAAIEALRKAKLADLGVGGTATPPAATSAGAETATPAQLALLAGDQAAPATVRVAAAERGARSGVVTVEMLVAAYAALPLDPVVADEILAAAAVDPDNARAILARGLATDLPAQRRLAVVDAYVATLPGPALAGAKGRLATDRLDGIDPATAGTDASVRIARLLYAVGERARPVAWHRAALAGTSVATSRLDLARLIPLSLAAAAIDPPGSFAAWAEAEAAASGTSTDARIRVAAVAEILDALGVRVPPVDGRDALFAEPGRSPDPPTILWSTLEAASAAGRVAETALAAIGLLGPDGPASAGASATAAAIRGLVAIDLVDEARAIAREAILARLE